MTPDTAQATKALEALFRTYPGFRADDLTATVKTYLHAVSIYETRDVIKGISDFITGNVPGHNPAFAPSAPQVGSAVRQAMDRRLDSERRTQMGRPRLPPPDIEKSPESRARIKAKVDALVANLTFACEAEMTDSAMLRRAAERHDAYFAPTLRYSVGDPDAEHGDMGQREAS